jgi:Beta-propeller repeat
MEFNNTHCKRLSLSLILGWRHAIILNLVMGSLVGLAQVAHAQTPSDNGTPSRVMDAYRKLPLRFEPNQGQTDPQVDFVSRGDGYSLFLTRTEAVLRLRSGAGAQSPSLLDRSSDPRSRRGTDTSQVLRMRLVGGNSRPAVAGIDKQAGVSNYLTGNDPAQWRTNVEGYGKVRYRDVYPSIDLVYYGNQRQLEYDFIVEPGGDPTAIRLAFEADGLRIDEDGSLVLAIGEAEVRQLAPFVYQDIAGRRRSIAGRYRLLTGNTVGFEIDAYDRSRSLVIDPVLQYSTYLGGTGDDEGYGIAVYESGGSAYALVAGGTTSNDFPRQAPHDSTNDGTMTAFVTKFNAAGSALVFSTYLGGSDWDRASSIAVDPSGQAHVTGETCSSNFPTLNALQATHGGNCDLFVTKLNFAGSALLYSTYVGGSQYDVASLLGMDGVMVVVGGTTASSNFPVLNAFQSTRAGGLDGVVLRIKDNGQLDYSTYIGGTGDDGVTAVAVNSGGQPILTGYTASTNFPTLYPVQSANGGLWDAFVVKLSSSFVLEYSTYLGGNGYDYGVAVDVDSNQYIYVAGATRSTNFPTLNPLQAANGGETDAFVTKMNKDNLALMYSTYLGGTGDDEAWGINLTGTSDNAYVVGWTSSNNFPGATPLAYHGEYDGFVSRFNSAGSGLVWAEYLGGGDFDMVTALAGDSFGKLYVVGITLSTDYPTQSPRQANNAGGMEAFVAKITSDAAGDLNSLLSEIQP